MYSTQVYLYQQRTQVLLMDSSGQYFTARFSPVYAKRLTINLGVDNVLLFSFVNQDQKPVNVTGCTFTFRLTDTQGTNLLLQEPMTILNAPTGQVKVFIPAADTLELIAQPASYSIAVQSGNLTQADVEKLDLNNADFARGPVYLQNKIASFAPQLTQAWYNNRKLKSTAQQPQPNSKTPTVGQQTTLTGKNGIKFTYQWQGNVWGLVTKNGIGKSANKAVADELFKQTGTVPPYQSTKQDNQQQNNQTQQTATSGNPSEDILINFAKASGYEGQGKPNNLNFVRYLINTINDDTKRKEFINRIRLLYSS